MTDNPTRRDAGGRLLPSTIDQLALSRPNDIFFSIPKDENDLMRGFDDISCIQFSNAINHAAVWLQGRVGENDDILFDSLAYLGPNDLRYPILAIAAAKHGKQVRTLI
jgi:hypothetical protein